MKKIITLLAVAGAAVSLSACKKAETFELEASKTHTAFRANPHAEGYIGFAKVTTNADGKVSAVNVDEYRPITAWGNAGTDFNYNQDIAQAGGAQNSLKDTDVINKARTGAVGICSTSGGVTTFTEYTYAKYIKIADTFYEAVESADKSCALSAGAKTYKALETYKPVGIVSGNVEPVLGKDVIGTFNATNAGTIGALLSSNEVKIATLGGTPGAHTLEVATYTTLGTPEMKLGDLTKKATGYGIKTGNYGFAAWTAKVEGFTVANTKHVYSKDWGTYALTNAGTSDLTLETGATMGHTPNYFIIVQDAIKALKK